MLTMEHIDKAVEVIKKGRQLISETDSQIYGIDGSFLMKPDSFLDVFSDADYEIKKRHESSYPVGLSIEYRGVNITALVTYDQAEELGLIKKVEVV